MNLHICLNGNFVDQAMAIFEHFFPGKNVFIVFEFGDSRVYREDIPIYHYRGDDVKLLYEIQKITQEYKIDNVLNHGLAKFYVPVFQFLKKNKLYSGKVYWIFWGYELYNALGELGRYKLTDDNSILLKIFAPSPYNFMIKKIFKRVTYQGKLESALPYMDYFCTWLPYDFDLLHKNFKTDAKFKFFKYGSLYKKDAKKTDTIPKRKDKFRIMVNHQASMTGNHKTILKKLKRIKGIEDFDICTPLSYGSKFIRKYVLRVGKCLFRDRYKPLLKLMPVDKYDEFLSSTSVAIFGAKRQEAAGNIITLLKTGAKVFLREENPLYLYYKEKGYLIFSFENDLNEVSDLEPLSDEEQLYNMRAYFQTQVYYEDFMPVLFD